MRFRQRGFTLIEALIAFVVLTVGLIGASLFQSNLIGEVADTKTRLEAIKLATFYAEKLRSASTLEEFNTLMSGSTVSSSGSAETYSITVSPVSVDSSISNFASQAKISVSWSTSSVSVESIVTWQDPRFVLNIDEAGVKSTFDDGLGLVAFPAGKASAVDRDVMSVSAGSPGDVVSQAVDSSIVYGVSVDGASSPIALVQVNDVHTPIIRIDGYVVNNSVSPITSSVLDYIPSASGGSSSVIDVRSSAGSNCIVYEIDAGRNYGKYVCLMSEGWTGNIVVDQYPAETNKTLLDYSNYVCYSSPRGYKYLILDLSDNVESGAIISGVSASSASFVVSGAETFLNVTYGDTSSSATIQVTGQSGLVRFVSTGGYSWDDYFWHNPNLVNSTGFISVEGWGDVKDQNFFLSKKSGNKDSCVEFSGDLTTTLNSISNAELSTSFDLDLFGTSQPITNLYNRAGDVILGYTTQ